MFRIFICLQVMGENRKLMQIEKMTKKEFGKTGSHILFCQIESPFCQIIFCVIFFRSELTFYSFSLPKHEYKFETYCKILF
jgi:hypothetical protein